MKNNKKIVMIVAMVALVAMLALCLVACNKEDYKKRLEDKDYIVIATDSYEGEDIEWALNGTKKSLTDPQNVTVIKFSKSADAKDFADKLKGDNKDAKKNVYRTGSIVIFGTEQGVKDAK